MILLNRFNRINRRLRLDDPRQHAPDRRGFLASLAVGLGLTRSANAAQQPPLSLTGQFMCRGDLVEIQIIGPGEFWPALSRPADPHEQVTENGIPLDHGYQMRMVMLLPTEGEPAA